MRPLKPLRWVASSRDDLRAMPAEARRDIGYALQFAQAGTKHPAVKPLRGMGGGILEVVEDHDGNTYRAVYAVRFKKAVYVLHAFQKKLNRGIATPVHVIRLIENCLLQATRDYAQFKNTFPETRHEETKKN